MPPIEGQKKKKKKKYYAVRYRFFCDFVQAEVSTMCCWGYRKYLLVFEQRTGHDSTVQGHIMWTALARGYLDARTSNRTLTLAPHPDKPPKHSSIQYGCYARCGARGHALEFVRKWPSTRDFLDGDPPL